MFRKKRTTDNNAGNTQEPNGDAAYRNTAEEERPKLEKGDLPAMIIAALGVFLPVLILVAVLLIGILWFIFIR